MRSFSILFGAMLASACTSHLEVARADSDEASRSGFAYPLQFTQWNVTLTRRLAACEPEVNALIKTDIVPATVDDGDNVYVIASDSLISPLKVSELQIAWDEGRLKSVNASAEDRTAETAAAAVQGIGKVISLASNVGLLPVQGSDQGAMPQSGIRLMCKAEAKAHLAIVDSTEAEVERAGSAITVGIAEATRLKDQLAQVGEDATLSGLLKAELEKIDREKKNLTAAKKKLEASLAFLTHEQVVAWPEASGVNWTGEGQEFKIPLPALQKWFALVEFRNGQPVTRKDEAGKDVAVETLADQQRLRAVEPWFAAYMRIERVGSYGRDPAAAQSVDAKIQDGAGRTAGIRYRLPARGRLVVCQAKLCTSADKGDVVGVALGPILQLGHIFYAPFSSPPFSNGTFAIAFDEFGRPVTAGVARKSASAERAAGMARDIVSEAATVADAVYRSPLERVQEERLFLEESKKLADARSALNPGKTPLQQLQEQTQLAKAQKDYDDAMKALEAPAADPNAAARSLQAGFEADAAVKKAERDAILADIALDELKRQRDGM